ncbi:MAG: hypothetical protein PHE53_00225 [Thermoguttaceae bacterium]|nr:hypothetical protein [Thermoguttaceae bacterium]
MSRCPAFLAPRSSRTPQIPMELRLLSWEYLPSNICSEDRSQVCVSWVEHRISYRLERGCASLLGVFLFGLLVVMSFFSSSSWAAGSAVMAESDQSAAEAGKDAKKTTAKTTVAEVSVTEESEEPADGDPGAAEFLASLQQRGYYDLAIDYLNWLKTSGQLPTNMSELWDLEMSRGLMEMSTHAYNEEESKKLLEQAQGHLNQFLKEHPDHPDAYRSLTIWGDFSRDAAQKTLQKIELPDTTAAQRTELLAEAAKAIAEAKGRYTNAQKQLANRLENLPPEPPKMNGRSVSKAYKKWFTQQQSLLDADAQANFQLAVLEYLSAQILDPKYTAVSPDTQAETRKTIYQSAAGKFDALYQKFRISSTLSISLIGLLAHRWEGKCWLEYGDTDEAEAILEEVMNNYRPGVSPAILPLFSAAQYDLYQLIKIRKPNEYLALASQWLDDNEKIFGHTEGYQAIAYMVAEGKAELLKNASGNSVAVPVIEQSRGEIFENVVAQNMPKNRLARDIDSLLRKILKVPSPYQKKALALRGQLGATDSGQEEGSPLSLDNAKTFAEAASVGNQHANKKEWKQAAEAYTKAISIGSSDKAQLDEAKDMLLKMQVAQGNDLLLAGEYTKCFQSMDKLWKANRQLPSAGLAGTLAMRAALALQNTAKDAESKAKAKERLATVAKEIMDTWPAKPAADDARIMLGQAALADAFADLAKIDETQFAEAMKIFGQVNPLSERYPSALSTMAKAYWQRYLVGKSQQDAEDVQNARRNSAVEYAQKSKDAAKQQAAKQPGGELSAFEAQYLLGEMAMEKGDSAAALTELQPIVDSIGSPDQVTPLTNAALLTATRAYLEQGDIDGAAKSALVLIDSGADTQSMNRTLVNFAKRLDMERKSANAEQIQAVSETDKQRAAQKVQRAEEMMGRILPKLTSRQQLDVSTSLSLADLCITARRTDDAKAIFERLIAASDTDPRAVLRSRAQLAGLLRIEKKYTEAFQQVDILLKENPNAFEPLVEKARILQDWASADNNTKLFDDAASAWISLRNRLQGQRGPKPPEFFEVNYNAAVCLYQQAIKLTAVSPEKANEKLVMAKQLLQGTLVMNKSLDGPDRVAQYRQQIKKIDDILKANKK